VEKELSNFLIKNKIIIKDSSIFDTAFTHKSFCNNKNLKSNEQLEHLGDAVIGLAISDYIYRNYPDLDEGEMTKIKSKIVNGKTISKKAKELNLNKYLKLGKGEEKTGGRDKKSILENTFEAFIGAIYINSGYEITKDFIHQLFRKEIEKAKQNKILDYKSELQEIIQKKFCTLPQYKVVNVTGQEHKKIFEITISINDKIISYGKGKSKKEAQQNAAKNALKYISKVQ
jgi:ribonuclease-3